jgi:NAD(P)-dependent dehydrogenase (short-subunit alcohol dehydrogenase family)
MRKTVLITGCSSGFGRASALRFVAGGWNVVATMREPVPDAELDGRDDVLVTRLDVRDRASIAAAIDAGIARFGRIDAVVNNAGFGLHGIFEATPRERIEEQFAVNVFGVMDVTRAILPHFRKNRAGALVNVSSGAGVFTLPMISLYSASKHALEAFSESLSYELAPLGIRVKIVEPGGVTTTNFIRRSGAELGRTEAPADYDAFLASMGALFTALQKERGLATAEEVAQVIFDATGDPSDRLRYVATKDIAPLVKLRQEAGEDEYMRAMRARFAPETTP